MRRASPTARRRGSAGRRRRGAPTRSSSTPTSAAPASSARRATPPPPPSGTAARRRRGSAHAQYWLGSLLVNGEGVDRDLGRAEALWREAAAQELEAAQFALGCALRDGGRFGGGEAEGERRLRRAAEQGHEGAVEMLSRLTLGRLLDGAAIRRRCPSSPPIRCRTRRRSSRRSRCSSPCRRRARGTGLGARRGGRTRANFAGAGAP